MTDKEKEQILNEIERLENYQLESVCSSDTRFGWINGKIFALTSLRIFLDSMQEEPVSEDLEEEICREINQGYKDQEHIADLNYIARHFANWQKQQIMKQAVPAKITLLDGISFVSKDVLSKFKPSDKVKIIIIKEE